VSVLIIRKTTNYELYGTAVEARANEGSVDSGTLELLKTAHSEHHKTLGRLKELIRAKGFDFTEISRDDKTSDSLKFDHVITVGGDGTLLAVSHTLPTASRVLGIRSSASSVGYLCGASFDTLDSDLDAYFSGKLPVILTQRLVAVIKKVENRKIIRTVPVMNDFLFSNVSPAATTRYIITHNSTQESQRSSGIWISTAAGSTAAILTAGGIKQPPGDMNFQFKVRELYKMGHVIPKIDGAMFNPDKETLIIANRCQHAILAFDGQHGEIDLEYGDEISFERAAPLEVVKRVTS